MQSTKEGVAEKNDERKWTESDRRVVTCLLIAHGLCFLAPFQFNWNAFRVALILYVVTGLFGITLTFHRSLTHRSFKLPKWLEYLFAYCGVHAFQGDPIDWVSTHRYHHRFVDSERDPHSPIAGLWFSHIGWSFDSYSLTKKVTPEFYEGRHENSGRQISPIHNMFTLYIKHGRPNNVNDLEKQPFYGFLRNTYILHPIALAALLYRMGGLPFLVWGMGVRIVFVLHITFSVNSVCHRWGKQQWNTGDLSKNNWWVALLAFGEGWHNNHHAFETSARHGIEWWQLDTTWWVIMFLEAIGLATDVKLPSQKQKQIMAFKKVEPCLA